MYLRIVGSDINVKVCSEGYDEANYEEENIINWEKELSHSLEKDNAGGQNGK